MDLRDRTWSDRALGLFLLVMIGLLTGMLVNVYAGGSWWGWLAFGMISLTFIAVDIRIIRLGYYFDMSWGLFTTGVIFEVVSVGILFLLLITEQYFWIVVIPAIIIWLMGLYLTLKSLLNPDTVPLSQ